MSYVIKFGEYYLKNISFGVSDMTIKLSKELMRGYNDIEKAEKINKLTGGQIIEIKDEVTNEEV